MNGASDLLVVFKPLTMFKALVLRTCACCTCVASCILCSQMAAPSKRSDHRHHKDCIRSPRSSASGGTSCVFDTGANRPHRVVSDRCSRTAVLAHYYRCRLRASSFCPSGRRLVLHQLLSDPEPYKGKTCFLSFLDYVYCFTTALKN